MVVDFLKVAFKDGYALADLLERKQVRFKAVVQVGGVVGDFVGEVDELGLERRALVQSILGKFRKAFRIVVAGVFDDAFADFEGQVQAAKGSVANLKVFDDAQRVEIVIEEESMLPHDRVQGLLACVPERRMPDVVDQSQRLDQINVQVQGARKSARNLRNLKRVGQPVAKVIGVAAGENLGLGFEAAEGTRVDNPVTVALEVVAVGMLRLGVAATARLLYAHRVISEHGKRIVSKFQSFKDLEFHET